MRLSDVFPNLPTSLADAECSSIAHDSRSPCQRALYVAIKGSSWDGHDFVKTALESGAIAAVVQQDHPTREFLEKNFRGKILAVKDTRDFLGRASARFYDEPSKTLQLFGVTGTNGKTSVTYLIEAILKKNKIKTGVIGTVENRLNDYKIESTHTTPHAPALQKILYDFEKRSAKAVAIEVSSHALDQKRVSGCHFRAAIFTNLTQDHLDYHGTLENYGLAKKRFFEPGLAEKIVINTDDAFGEKLAAEFNGPRLVSYGLRSGRYQIAGLTYSLNGIEGTLLVDAKNEGSLRSNLVGEYNALNILAAIAATHSSGLPMAEILDAVRTVSIPGRLERIENKKKRHVFVDYAHTPDALEKVLSTLARLKKNRLICLFGCGGDRDRSKRPLMGGIAEKWADSVILTSDNPRGEDPEKILSEIENGMRKSHVKIISRGEAIESAVRSLHAEDILLIAGKGHEDYQIVRGQKFHFDDREKAHAALELL